MAHMKPFDPARLAHRPKPEADFVAALAAFQESHGLTDVEFAGRIGVSPELWRHTKAGRLDLGVKLLAAGANLAPYDVASAANSSLLRRLRARLKGTVA